MGVHTQGCSEAHRQKPLFYFIFEAMRNPKERGRTRQQLIHRSLPSEVNHLFPCVMLLVALTGTNLTQILLHFNDSS
jgi:hypothetical protein